MGGSALHCNGEGWSENREGWETKSGILFWIRKSEMPMRHLSTWEVKEVD